MSLGDLLETSPPKECFNGLPLGRLSTLYFNLICFSTVSLFSVNYAVLSTMKTIGWHHQKTWYTQDIIEDKFNHMKLIIKYGKKYVK